MFGNQDTTEQSGLMGLFNSPVGQGLLAAGLGAMGSRGNAMQAIGRGGLLGMSTYGQAQEQRENKLLTAAKDKARQDALAAMAPDQNGVVNATPAQMSAAGFNDPSKWGDIRNFGRDKLKEMLKVTGADGSQSIHGVNEYGGVQNTGLTNAPEIKSQDLGGQVSGINPYTGQQAWAADKTATIGDIERARSNRASEGLTARGQNMQDARSRETNALTLSKPFEVLGADGKPMLVQQDKAGNIRPVEGFMPKSAFEKPLPTTALKMIQESKDAIGTASGINSDLGSIYQQIEDGKLSFGPVSNLLSAGRNAAGLSSENSRNYASFKTSLEKLRNDSLRLNKGVQTDGDAQRAWNELFQNINDTQLVKERLQQIQRLNDRAVQVRQLDIDGVLQNYGRDPMDTSGYTNQPSAISAGGNAPRQNAPSPKPAAGGWGIQKVN